MEQEVDKYVNDLNEGRETSGLNFEKHDDYKYIIKLLEEGLLIEDRLEKAKKILKIYEEFRTKKKYLLVDTPARNMLLVKAEEFKDSLEELLSEEEYFRFLVCVEDISTIPFLYSD